MLFKARELHAYAKPISVNELQEGSVYFAVSFADTKMHIPVMDTLVFIGSRLDEVEENGNLYFQDIDSHEKGVRWNSAEPGEKGTFIQCEKDQLNSIYEYEEALNVLLRCSLRRSKLKGPN